MKKIRELRGDRPLNLPLKSGIFPCLILGLDHGIADATAGFLLGCLPRTMSLEEASLLIIFYNVLGFGYQPVAGMLTDRLKKYRMAVLIGLFFLLAALSVGQGGPSIIAVILAGIGSAFFHVGGGALAFKATPDRTMGPGIFAAPGVIGLAVGGVLGLTGYDMTMPLVLLLGITIVTTAAMPKLPEKIMGDRGNCRGEAFGPENHVIQRKIDDPNASPCPHQDLPESQSSEDDGIILMLVSAIALTSTVWTSYQFLLQTQMETILALAVAAAVGKIMGGIWGDRYNWQKLTIGTQSVAAMLLAISGQNRGCLIVGLGLLQSSIPITLTAMGRMMPKQPATAAGFALGLAIIIGGIPIMGGLSYITGNPAIAAGMAISAALSLWWVLKAIKNSSR